MAGAPTQPPRLDQLRRELAQRQRLLDARLAALAVVFERIYGSPRAAARLVGVRTRSGHVLRRQALEGAPRLELVGVRRGADRLRFAPRLDLPSMVPVAPPPVPERAIEVEALAEPPEVAQVLDPETIQLAEAPPVPPAWKAADATIAQIDQAIRLVEEELGRLAEKERLLTDYGSRAAGRPYRLGEYTLYASPRESRDGGLRVDYRFRATATRDAIPVPLPEGYRVRRNPRTDVPYLENEAT